MVGPTHSRTPGPHWKARRWRGREGWERRPSPQPSKGLGTYLQAPQRGPGRSQGRKRIWWNLSSKMHVTNDDKNFGNFQKTVVVKMTFQSFTDNDFLTLWYISLYGLRAKPVDLCFIYSICAVLPVSCGSKATPAGYGEEPQPKSNFVHFALKFDIWWQ